MFGAAYVRLFAAHFIFQAQRPETRICMRRLVLEFPLDQFRFPFPKVKVVGLLHLLKQTKDEYEAICRVEFKTAAESDPWTGSSTKTLVQVLSREKDGSAIVYLKGKPLDWLDRYLEPALSSSGVHQQGLFELQEGKLRAAFIGSPRQVGRFLRRLEELRIGRNILSLDDARFSPDSPLYALTEKQRQVLIAAFRSGYFEIPRRANFEQLSRRLGMGRSTINEHLRKAEIRLVSRLLDENVGHDTRW
jgi:hypothetical protein